MIIFLGIKARDSRPRWPPRRMHRHSILFFVSINCAHTVRLQRKEQAQGLKPPTVAKARWPGQRAPWPLIRTLGVRSRTPSPQVAPRNWCNCNPCKELSRIEAQPARNWTVPSELPLPNLEANVGASDTATHQLASAQAIHSTHAARMEPGTSCTSHCGPPQRGAPNGDIGHERIAPTLLARHIQHGFTE